jgi:uncharacterized repeat protein (TIGR03803 family)
MAMPRLENMTVVRKPGARPEYMAVLARTAAMLAIACGCCGTALATPPLKVIYTFKNLRGANPIAGLIADGAGNLYGTAQNGGKHGDGVVYELSPPIAGETAWTGKVLHAFDDIDGAQPTDNLIADGAGVLYGTTSTGGANGLGTVFKLAPPAPGSTAWTETVLYSFSQTKGLSPFAGLLADSKGNLYGTATGVNFGSSDAVVFELSPPTGGKTAWTETELVDFAGPNGAYPRGSLIADQAGNLYGTTVSGGANGGGVVFELSPPALGDTAWTEAVLFSFDVADGANPFASLLADSAGNLYGTTDTGGKPGPGVVFELSPPVAGQTAWTERVLHSFNRRDGAELRGPLIEDSAGNLYGTASAGGSHYVGVVFRLTP